MESSFIEIKSKNDDACGMKMYILCKEKSAMHEENRRLRQENDEMRQKLAMYKIL